MIGFLAAGFIFTGLGFNLAIDLTTFSDLGIALLLFFIIYSASAEIVTTEGAYTFAGDISKNEACSLAKERAKLKALEKVLGQTISSDEMENCSEVDGKTSCERNQFFLSSFNGEITGLKQLNREVTSEQISSGEEISICKIKIKADVTIINEMNLFIYELKSYFFSKNFITLWITKVINK